jgi:hypothetical protein
MAKTLRKNEKLFLAHRDGSSLTYDGVSVPTIVPVYENFNVSNRIGMARLSIEYPCIYAVVKFDLPPSKKMGDMPRVVLAISGATREVREGVQYVCGGTVTAASTVTREAWLSLYGSESEEETG